MTMARKKQREAMSKGSVTVGVINPDAAGIDIGATELYVAVPADRDSQAVRSFGAFTEDLHQLADWLQKCRIKTVAMESTGVYWIPAFQILEARGFEVCLVNARHVKNVPGRKSDVADCQWLQYLHSVGLLRSSFRPVQAVCAVRSLMRHRDNLVKMATCHIQHMQKALTQMNVQIHNVLSDISGVTGLAIIDAILAGERDPNKLAELRDRRVKADKAIIAKSLVGDYRAEHVFALKQALTAYRHYQQLLNECDTEIERHLTAFESKAEASVPGQGENPKGRRPQANDPKYDLRSHMHRILGVDLTAVPGIGSMTASTIFSEIGADVSKFPSEKHFLSWLRLCPENRISGGKLLSSRGSKSANRAAQALRIAAQTMHHNHSLLGEYYRRIQARLGGPVAISATAAKLARIIYHLLKTRQAYDETIFADNENKHKERLERRLRNQAHMLGFKLIPAAA
jgi:transposase